MRAVTATLYTDGLRMLRDRFLLGASAYMLACAVALRWVVPWLRGELLAAGALDIQPWVPLGVSYFVVVNASVVTGMIGGFLLLESREERTIQALLVTPTSIGVPVATLSGVIAVAGVLITTVLAGLVGVGVPDSMAVVASALVGAPMGVIMALILATAAANKVEAFALMKVTTFLGLIPIGAFFLPEPLQYVAGVVPIYWACKIWWVACEGGSWAWMVLPALGVHVAWIAVLWARLRSAAYRGAG